MSEVISCAANTLGYIYSVRTKGGVISSQLRYRVVRLLSRSTEVPVVQQDVGPPDLAVGEPDVGHAWIVGRVPLQVEICPVLQTRIQKPNVTNGPTHLVPTCVCVESQTLFGALCRWK